MITEAYCSFEVSELLEEKGFNESCYTYYDDIDNSINRFDKGLHFNNTSYPWGVPYDISKAKKYVVAPTHQMAMAWLRKEKYVLIFIVPAKDENSNLTYCADVWTWNDDEGIYEPTWAYANYIYEEAVEAAINYSLENLI